MPRRFSGPLLPGQRSVKHFARPRPRRRPATKGKSLTLLIKKVSLNQCESIRKSEYSEGIHLGHNQTHYVTRIMATTQGVTNPSRHMPPVSYATWGCHMPSPDMRHPQVRHMPPPCHMPPGWHMSGGVLRFSFE